MKKTVLITGASRGIGRDMAQLFAENGYQVVINYLYSEKEAKQLEKQLKEHGYSAFAVRANICNPRETERMFRLAEEVFGEDKDIEEEAAIDKKAELPEAVCVEEPQAACNYIEKAIECEEIPVENFPKKKKGSLSKKCINCVNCKPSDKNNKKKEFECVKGHKGNISEFTSASFCDDYYTELAE